MFPSSKTSEVITTSVLLTDGSFKHTLAAVRSLGIKGIDSTVVDSSIFAQSFYSAFCKRRYIIPTPSKSPKKYILHLRRILEKHTHNVLLPIGWESNYYISTYRHQLEPLVSIPLADHDKMVIAANKDKTVKFASQIGVNTPKTFYPQTLEDIVEIAKNHEFPLVIKSSVDAGYIFYAQSRDDLQKYFIKMKSLRPIVQEYIQGYGCGYFALYKDGKCLAQFMHRRLREYPISGGPSVAAEAYYSKDLQEQGKKLLDGLNWTGVAMVEFKRDMNDGKYKLMEINPKFWGSLELAIASGVDFPYLAYQMAMDVEFSPVMKYNTKMKFRWPFPGDLLHALETRSLRDFFSRFGDYRYQDDIYLRDMGPLVMQFMLTLNSVRKRHVNR
ncbi:MAG: ATP-grasp domain-containing protein [Candidatus Thorarchaeota archaeon]